MWFLLACFVNNSLKGLLTAGLLRRISAQPIWFEKFRRFTTYRLIAVLLVPALSAFGGAASRARLGDDFWEVWKRWFLGDALAALVCAPLLILACQHYREWLRLPRRVYFRASLMLLGLVTTDYLAFQLPAGPEGHSPFMLYLPLPFLVWAAVEFGPPGASAALCLLSVSAIFGVGAGAGPFAYMDSAASMLSIQLFLAAVSLPVMLLAVMVYQQRRTDLALRESEGRFRSLVNTAPVMVWMSDRYGLCTFFNRPWLDFTGRPLEKQLGEGWLEGVHPEDRDHCVERYLEAVRLQKEFSLEYRLRRSDGVYRWVMDKGVPRYATGGSYLGYIGSCVDFTDRKDAEERTRELSAQLLNAQELERYRIGQELHDDLAQRAAALSMRLSQLARRRADDPELSRVFDGLRQQAAEMCEDISRISHQLHPATLETVDLPVALRVLCEQSATDECAVVFNGSVDSTALPESASVPLFRVAQEALRNAITHSGATRVEISAHNADSGICLTVKDNGCGFIVASFGGSGLGLSGMTERMRQAGGTLQVSSRPGLGTLVTATLSVGRRVRSAASG